MSPKIGMRVLITSGPWTGHTGVIRETNIRDLFIRVDLENGIESLTLPALCRFVPTEDRGGES